MVNTISTHPYGDAYIFPPIALATYKLVTKTVSNTYPRNIACNRPSQICTKIDYL